AALLRWPQTPPPGSAQPRSGSLRRPAPCSRAPRAPLLPWPHTPPPGSAQPRSGSPRRPAPPPPPPRPPLPPRPPPPAPRAARRPGPRRRAGLSLARARSGAPTSHAALPRIPGAAEAARAAHALREGGDFAPDDAGDRRDHELRDAVAVADAHWLASEVDEEDAHLAAVVGVDRAGRVEHREAVAGGEAAPRPDLPFEPGR